MRIITTIVALHLVFWCSVQDAQAVEPGQQRQPPVGRPVDNLDISDGGGGAEAEDPHRHRGGGVAGGENDRTPDSQALDPGDELRYSARANNVSVYSDEFSGCTFDATTVDQFGTRLVTIS